MCVCVCVCVCVILRMLYFYAKYLWISLMKYNYLSLVLFISLLKQRELAYMSTIILKSMSSVRHQVVVVVVVVVFNILWISGV